MLYVCETQIDTLVTHDGKFQLGLIHMSMSKFMSLVQSEYTEVYWIPDPVFKRYKTISYQRHLSAVQEVSTYRLI